MNQQQVLQYIAAHADQPELLKPIRLAADKAIQAYNATLKANTGLVPKYSTDALKMATWLAEQVMLRYPYTKQPNLEQWADDIDKLVRCIKQPLDNKIALLFSQQDTSGGSRYAVALTCASITSSCLLRHRSCRLSRAGGTVYEYGTY